MNSSQSSDEVFALLANETRIKILEALAHAENEANPGESPPSLSFSEIYDRVNIDSTSKLSYHLGELVGIFIYKSEDGYSFTHVGDRIIHLILASNYEQPERFDPIEIDEQCLFCESIGLKVRLNHQSIVIACPACGESLTDTVTPAQIRSWDTTALLESIAVKQAAEYRQVLHGTCPACSGRMATDILAHKDRPLPENMSFLVSDECQCCLDCYTVPLSYRVAYHPASVAFYWDHGIDITSTGSWEMYRYLAENRWSAERLDTSPPEYHVILGYESEALHAYLDSEATIVRTERVRSRTVE